MEETHYTVKELSDVYNIPEVTIRSWIHHGDLKMSLTKTLKGVRGHNKILVISKSDFEQFLNDRKKLREYTYFYNGFDFKFSKEQSKKVYLVDRNLRKDLGIGLKEYLMFIINGAIDELYDNINSFEEGE